MKKEKALILDRGFCPMCGEDIWGQWGNVFNYCPNCGQAIISRVPDGFCSLCRANENHCEKCYMMSNGMPRKFVSRFASSKEAASKEKRKAEIREIINSSGEGSDPRYLNALLKEYMDLLI